MDIGAAILNYITQQKKFTKIKIKNFSKFYTKRDNGKKKEWFKLFYKIDYYLIKCSKLFKINTKKIFYFRLGCNFSLYVPEAKRQQLTAIFNQNLRHIPTYNSVSNTNNNSTTTTMLTQSNQTLSIKNDIEENFDSLNECALLNPLITDDEDYRNNIANSFGYIDSLMKIVQTSDENGKKCFTFVK